VFRNCSEQFYTDANRPSGLASSYGRGIIMSMQHHKPDQAALADSSRLRAALRFLRLFRGRARKGDLQNINGLLNVSATTTTGPLHGSGSRMRGAVLRTRSAAIFRRSSGAIRNCPRSQPHYSGIPIFFRLHTACGSMRSISVSSACFWRWRLQLSNHPGWRHGSAQGNHVRPAVGPVFLGRHSPALPLGRSVEYRGQYLSRQVRV
jgi:hypothetical protein